MLKQLLLGSFILATPHPNNAITRPVYVEANFNKQQTQEYISIAGPTNNPSVITYANYAFNTQDDYQVIQGTVNTRTTNIFSTVFNNSTNTVTVKGLSINEINNNNYQYSADITTINSLNNIELENLTSYYIVYWGLVDYTELDNNRVNQAYTTSLNRYTQAYSISSQIDTIEGNMNQAEIYGDSRVSGDKTEDPTDFYQNLNEGITQMNYHYHFGYQTNGEVPQNKQLMYRYFNLEYTLDTTWQELTETTIKTYTNMLIGYNETIKIQLTYQSYAEIHTDVIDIPGLLFTILGMPFAWISTAFNLTLFPGTQYAVNVATIVLSIIGLLIAIFIIRRLLK